MKDPNTCDVCGAAYSSGAFGGMCPQCLLSGSAATVLPGSATMASPPEEPWQAPEGYEICSVIGRGGMGVVYRAKDLGLDREVALKYLQGDGLDPEFASRFGREARITARLDHPGIVPVHDVGYDAEGRGFYTMRLVHGRLLGEIFRLALAGSEGWNLSRAVGVMVKVCQTVAYAHSKGIVHRDLKPANIMAGELGEVYVMDWGLAKESQMDESGSSECGGFGGEDAGRLTSSFALTLTGTVVGTPDYMSPEQAQGHLEEVDFLSDVYSLGAILYDLLAGHPPYRPAGSTPTPQEVLAEVAQRAPAEVRKIRPDAPAELAAICGKAMHRDRKCRYATALELAEDLQAWLDGRVVRASRTGPLIELKKWVRRNRALAAAAAMAVLAVAGGLSATAIIHIRAERDVSQALDMEAAAKRETEEALADAFTQEGIRNGDERLFSRAAVIFHHAARTAPHDTGKVKSNRLRADLFRREALRPVRALRLPDHRIERLALHKGERFAVGELSAYSGFILMDLENERWLPLDTKHGILTAAAWSPAGDHLAVSMRPGEVDLLGVPDLKRTQLLRLPAGSGPVTSLAWSSDERLLFAGAKEARVFDTVAGAWLPPAMPHSGALIHATFSPDSAHLLSVTREGLVHLWALPALTASAPVASHFESLSNLRPYFKAGGAQFEVITAWDVSVVFDTATRAEVSRRILRTGWHDYSPNGTLIAGQNGVASVTDGKFICGGPLGRCTFSPDGATVFDGAPGSLVELWTGVVTPLEGHSGLSCAAFSRDGSCLITAQDDGLVRVWPVAQSAPWRFAPTTAPGHPAVSPDGRWLASCGDSSWGRMPPSRHVQVFALPGGAPAGTPFNTGGDIINATFAPDGIRFALAVSDVADRGRKDEDVARRSGHLEVRDWQSGRMVMGPVPMPSEPRDIAWSPDGASMAVMCGRGQVVHVDPATGAVRPLFTLEPFAVEPNERRFENGSVEFAAGSRVLAAWGIGRDVALWDLETEKWAAPLIQPINRPRLVRFDHEGFALVLDLKIHPVDAPWFWRYDGTPAPSGLAYVFRQETYCGGLSEDGRYFFVSGPPEGMKVWDWCSGALHCPDIPAPERSFAAFVPQTPWIVSAGANESDNIARVRAWDHRDGRAISPEWRLPGSDLRDLVLTPDGRTAVTSDSRLPGFHILSLPGTEASLSALSEDDERLLLELNAGGSFVEGGFVRFATQDWIERWQGFRRRNPSHHPWPIAAQDIRDWHLRRAAEFKLQSRSAAIWHEKQIH